MLIFHINLITRNQNHLQKYGQNITFFFYRDTAGKSRFESLGEMFLSEAMGVVFCFDISDRKSFTNLPHWMNKFIGNLFLGNENINVLLIIMHSVLILKRFYFAYQVNQRNTTQIQFHLSWLVANQISMTKREWLQNMKHKHLLLKTDQGLYLPILKCHVKELIKKLIVKLHSS